ncbi:hypothetical protein DTO195F2_4599 [Paecilomyces variotii]|nr:hypothetical protein DTO195F2_4599 [Paecilomyces variotii]KAJ9294631.1 hypothetical protein DTO217A2_9154 [Paecilomyces variotii]KAJ9371909.1 hypothetical protein DTO282E5_3530 [Paecilomyces variotii]
MTAAQNQDQEIRIWASIHFPLHSRNKPSSRLCSALLCSTLSSPPPPLTIFFLLFLFSFPSLSHSISLSLDSSILSARHTYSSFPVPSSPTGCTLVTLVFLRLGAVPGDHALDLLTACPRSSIIECLRLKVQVSVQAGGWQVHSKRKQTTSIHRGILVGAEHTRYRFV